VRDATAPGAHGLPAVAAGDLATATEEQLAMIVDGATAVVHLAGRAHIMRERLTDAPKRYDAANVLATGRLAAAAARAGVGHFVFASTVKIHGESTRPGRPFRAADPWAPQDVYARSKAKAERALTAACAGTAMVPLVLRLPLVYGPGVKGNFLSLMDAVARRALLPLGAIDNRRDLLYVGNLVHAIATLLASSEALGGAWLIADGEAMSTPMLARRIGAALRITPRLLSIPVPLLSLAARLTGRGSPLRRLTQSLEVDAAPWRERVGSAPFTVDEGLAETARWWRLRHAI
jgi:UDP-glucose 4-epimerase